MSMVGSECGMGQPWMPLTGNLSFDEFKSIIQSMLSKIRLTVTYIATEGQAEPEFRPGSAAIVILKNNKILAFSHYIHSRIIFGIRATDL
ncbi:hypothetical protein AKJ16_DCAP07151 [Drosera capensis]